VGGQAARGLIVREKEKSIWPRFLARPAKYGILGHDDDDLVKSSERIIALLSKLLCGIVEDLFIPLTNHLKMGNQFLALIVKCTSFSCYSFSGNWRLSNSN
jgi:hypothetical protein